MQYAWKCFDILAVNKYNLMNLKYDPINFFVSNKTGSVMFLEENTKNCRKSVNCERKSSINLSNRMFICVKM